MRSKPESIKDRSAVTENAALLRWIDECAQLTKPDSIHWCDGTQGEYDSFIHQMLRDGTLIELNQKSHPNCYLHRSHPDGVARTENLSFICTRERETAGPNNNWMSPPAAKKRAGKLFDGCMRGRRMYVIPYLMGPPGSPSSRVGVEVTDSLYVAASMHIVTRVGNIALAHLGTSEDFVPGLHSIGDLSPDRRFILHFPEEKLI
jgi:phosphoenolpyruvate carboxykinase (GTP)